MGNEGLEPPKYPASKAGVIAARPTPHTVVFFSAGTTKPSGIDSRLFHNHLISIEWIGGVDLPYPNKSFSCPIILATLSMVVAPQPDIFQSFRI